MGYIFWGVMIIFAGALVLGAIGFMIENPKMAVSILILGGIGFGMGNTFTLGWGIFGGLLGCFIALSILTHET